MKKAIATRGLQGYSGPVFLYPNKPVRFRTLDRLVESIDLNAWIVQPKWDGIRIFIAVEESGVTAWSRHKLKLSESKDLQFLADLKLPKPFCFDGELIRHESRIVLWDMPICGESMLTTLYTERVVEMRQHFPLVANGYKVECIETLPARQYKKLLLRRAELEGLVFKNTTTRAENWGIYSTGEHPSQLKFIFE